MAMAMVVVMVVYSLLDWNSIVVTVPLCCTLNVDFEA